MTRARRYDRDTALDAAMNLFWAKGYHATSLKDLEAALSMKPGSIYAAFSSKEALFGSALERYFSTMRDALGAELRQADSPLEGLADYLRRLGRVGEGGPQCRACMLVKTLLDATEAESALAAQARGYLDTLLDDFSAVFERAKACGELPSRADPARLARRYQSAITALKIEAHRGTDRAELARLADDLAREVERMRVPSN